MHIEKNILDAVNEWLTPTFDAETQRQVIEMMTSAPKLLEDSFYKNLEFGTGGMRGVMGVGTNRINKYTLGKNTQGLSKYIKNSFPNIQPAVVIAYDCRHNSDTLARIVADVFTANGIKVFLFSEMRPTPELSFAVRHLGCQCGIVLTASHNPPEYNGYKVYWEDGGQLVPPQDSEIIKVIEDLDYNQIKFDGNPNLIEVIDKQIDEAFVQSAIENVCSDLSSEIRESVSVVFSSLHGTAIKIMPQALRGGGFTNLHIVEEQATPDGDFPTVVSPNPEEPEAMTMALALAEKVHGDIIIATDPDSDRLGVGVRDEGGKMILLNGNQSMVLMTHYLLEKWKKSGKIDGKQFVGSTIVSTPMMMELATGYDVECKVGLTGFKWIAKMIKDFPELQFIGGGEESFGYMVGDAVRDKDAIASALLFCEIAAEAKANGKSVMRVLKELYVRFGFYKEALVSLTRKGIDGAAEINKMMIELRLNPKTEINGQRVVMVEDYQSATAKNMFSNDVEELKIPKSNVLIYYTEDGTKIAARPSGTEPKIKFYISVNEGLESVNDYDHIDAILDEKIKNILLNLNII